MLQEGKQPWELPHTRLADTRWVEVAFARLKEVDDMVERRSKVRQRRPQRVAPDAEAPNAKGEDRKGEDAAAAAKKSRLPWTAATC